MNNYITMNLFKRWLCILKLEKHGCTLSRKNNKNNEKNNYIKRILTQNRDNLPYHLSRVKKKTKNE